MKLLTKNIKKQNIVFFDGICGLCNETVDLLIKLDKREILKFSPLQSDFAIEMLKDINVNQNVFSLDTVVYGKIDFIDNKPSNKSILIKSNAIIEIFWDFGGIWKLAIIGKILPLFLRDKIYDYIARNRYNLLGGRFKKKETCRIPTPEERARFLM